MAATSYIVLDEGGNPVGTTTCQGDTCFPALRPGQSRIAAEGPSRAAPAVTTVDPTGKRVNPVLPAPQSPFPSALPGVDAARSPSVAPVSTPASPTPAFRTETAPESSGVFVPPAPQYAPPASFGGGYSTDSPFATLPAFQDGSVHPAAGGPPRVAGGPAAMQSQGYDNRQQVYVPGGAAAGPFETRAAYPADQPAYGGNAVGSSGGGGGGLAREMYHRIKGEVEGKLSGMGPGGSAAAAETTTDAQYRRQGRRMDRASTRYWDEVNDPDPQQATGWARRNLGQNRGNYPLYLTEPIRVATEGLGLDPMESSGTFDFLSGLPMADLAMIQGGTRARGLTRRTQPVKVPGILKGQIDPAKPASKRELDYSKYANQLRTMYQQIAGPSGAGMLDTGNLLGKLARAKNSGALRQGIEMQAEYDPGGAMDRARGYFDSIFGATQDDLSAQTYSDMANRYFADTRVGNKKPRHMDRVVRQVARKFL